MAKSAAERMREYRDRNRIEKDVIKCAHCHYGFIPKRSTAIYCSSECRGNARRKRIRSEKITAHHAKAKAFRGASSIRQQRAKT